MAFRVSKISGHPGARNIELRKVPGRMYGFNLCKDVYHDIHYVDCVFTNSAADCAGMKPDDIVVAVNKEYLYNMKLGDTVDQIYSRHDKVHLLVVRPWAYQQFITSYSAGNLNRSRESDHNISPRTLISQNEHDNVTTRQVKVQRSRERSRYDINENVEPKINNKSRSDVQRPRQRKYRDVSPNKAHVTITNIEDRRHKPSEKPDKYPGRMKPDHTEPKHLSRKSFPLDKKDIGLDAQYNRVENWKYLGFNNSPPFENNDGISRLRVSLSDGRMNDSKPTPERELKYEPKFKAESTMTTERQIYSRDSRDKDRETDAIQADEKSPNHTVAIQTEQLLRPSDQVDSLERSLDRKVKPKHSSPRIAKSQEKLDSKSVCHLKPEEVEALMCLEKAYCDKKLTKATTGFECRGCFTWRQPSKGVSLIECGHVFCKPCIIELIHINPGLEIKCPKSLCHEYLLYHEMKQILTPSAFKRHFNWTDQLNDEE